VKSIKSLQEIIFPARCLGCAALGLEICSQCRKEWRPHVYRQWISTNLTFPVYSAIVYSSVASRILLASKERNLKSADTLISKALSHALTYFLKEIGGDFFVPVPSRTSATRLRGRKFVASHTEFLSESTGLAMYDNLIHTRRVVDQSSLDAKARQKNLQGSLKSLSFISGEAIIIDDLVTTGATLQESARALQVTGVSVAGAVTACVAEPLRYDPHSR